MKKLPLILLLLINYAFAQVKDAAIVAKITAPQAGLKMTSTYGFKETEMLDWMRFEQIDYYQIKFVGADLKTKNYTISVKEIWNGKTRSESTLINSKDLKANGLDMVRDTVLTMKVMGKLTNDKKLKLSFMFPRFSTTKEYKALNSSEYSLRNLANESNLPIGYGEKFNFMAYILPYERKDGSKSWCEVGGSGNDIENWGKKFGIKHYILFDLKFE